MSDAACCGVPDAAAPQASGKEEAAKLTGGNDADAAVLKEARQLHEQARADKRRRDGAASAKLGPRKEKAKGPNPLSMLKKKKNTPRPASAAADEEEEAGPKKTRRRSKKANVGSADVGSDP